MAARRLVAAGAGAGALYAAYRFTREGQLYLAAKPLLDLTDAETAHRAGIAVGSRPWLVRALGFADEGEDHPSLRTRVWDLDFRNPVGIAAGYDKHAESIAGLSVMGFGFVEIGSVTPEPQPGNPRPRVFRLKEDGAVINRYGFNSEGLAAAAPRVAAWRALRDAAPAPKPREVACVLGANLGKNKTSVSAEADYAEGVAAFGEDADYLVVNVSSPNTPGLRSLQGRRDLQKLLGAVCRARAALPPRARPPVLVKIAPDLDDAGLKDVAEVALKAGIDGIVVSNTTNARPDTLRSPHALETGGLSGRPLLEPSTRVLGRVYELTGGKLPLIGVGGVASGEDAYAKIRAGASLVQLYTSFALAGPGVVRRVKCELAACLERDGFATVAEAVGADHREGADKGKGAA